MQEPSDSDLILIFTQLPYNFPISSSPSDIRHHGKVAIDSSVINSTFSELAQRFFTTDVGDGTADVVLGRGKSDYLILLLLFKETRRLVGGMTRGVRQRWFMAGLRSQI